MKVVLDTNLTISGLIYRGLPGRLLLAFEDGTHSLHTTPELLAELSEVIFRSKFTDVMARHQMTAQELFDGFVAMAHVIKAAPLPHPVCRDTDDDAVLACALATGVDWIVSGDKDLLVLQSFEGIPILTAAQALERLGT